MNADERHVHYSRQSSAAGLKGGQSLANGSALREEAPAQGIIKKFFFGSNEQVNIFIFAGRCLAFVLFAIWGFKFITEPMGSMEFSRSFMHNINLVFHEAGHVIFSPFGKLIKSLGGSLGQVLIPFIVAGAFLFKSNPFGATIGLWWAGQSMMDVAPYIADVRALAGAVHVTGLLMIVVALLWGMALLVRQLRRLDL